MTSFPMSVDAVTAEWRQLSTHLWVGRIDGRPLGTIEHGHLWTFTDVDGRVVRDLGSFAAAQRVALEPRAHRITARARRRRVGTLVGRVTVGLVALATSGLAAAGIALLVH